MKDQRLMDLEFLIGMIKRENRRQIEKWGIQDRDPMEWMVYAVEEVGETAEAISDHKYREGTKSNVVKEAIQAATLLLKIAEMYMADDVHPPELEGK